MNVYYIIRTLHIDLLSIWGVTKKAKPAKQPPAYSGFCNLGLRRRTTKQLMRFLLSFGSSFTRFTKLATISLKILSDDMMVWQTCRHY